MSLRPTSRLGIKTRNRLTPAKTKTVSTLPKPAPHLGKRGLDVKLDSPLIRIFQMEFLTYCDRRKLNWLAPEPVAVLDYLN